MKKILGIAKTALAVLGVLFLIVLFVGGKAGNDAKDTGSTSAQTQQESKASDNTANDKEKTKKEDVSKGQAEEKESGADESSVDETFVSPEFKEAMDSYEAFFDEYVEYMKAYQNDPTNTELLMGLSDMMSREAEMLEKFDEWENEEMTAAESAYYLKVQARITEKLAEVA